MKRLQINELQNSIYTGESVEPDMEYIYMLERIENKTKTILVTGIESYKTVFSAIEFDSITKNLEVVETLRCGSNPQKINESEIKCLKERGVSLLIAVGGGSVMDFAKQIVLELGSEIKFICVPTKLGSGAYVSSYAIFDNDEFKVGVHDNKLLPNVVYINTRIVDTELNQSVDGILDTFCHIFESRYSTLSTQASREIAGRAADSFEKYLLNKNIADFIEAEILSIISEQTGIVLFPHALGHYLTYKSGVPHGYASFIFIKDLMLGLEKNNMPVDAKLIKIYNSLVLEYGDLLSSELIKFKFYPLDGILINKYMDFIFASNPYKVTPNQLLDIYDRNILELQKKKNIDSFNRMKEYATNESSIYKTFKKTDLITEKIFTTKKMLRECYPYGTLACSKDSIVELHTTSGSTGKPSVSFYTHEDIRTTKEYISKSWANFGVDKDSVVMFMLSYGLFSGAALNTYAVQELGALVVPAGINSASKHIEMIIDFGVDTLVTTPSYLHYLITFINENNINKNQFNIKRIIVAGEFASIALKKSFGDYFSCRVFDHYGLCEVNTGVIYECIECGKNVAIKDYVFAEVVDGSGSETNLKGELVLTSLIKEASPVLRYRTGDGSTLMNDLSRCKNCFGSQVLERISGRVDGTIFYKGLKIDLAELKSFIINEVNFAIHQNSHFKLYVDKVDNVKEIVFCTKITQNFSEIEKSTLVKKVSNALKNGCSVQISLDIEILDSESIKLDNKVKLYEKSEI